MSIKSEITRITNAKKGLRSWLVSNGVSVSSSASLPDMVNLLGRVPTGGESEIADVTISNHTSTNLTVYGPDGAFAVSGNSDETMSTVVGGMIHISCLRKNLYYAAIPGEVISSGNSGAYLKITGNPCTVYITTNPIV